MQYAKLAPAECLLAKLVAIYKSDFHKHKERDTFILPKGALKTSSK